MQMPPLLHSSSHVVLIIYAVRIKISIGYFSGARNLSAANLLTLLMRVIWVSNISSVYLIRLAPNYTFVECRG